jgi:hypothetical protein
VTDDRLLLLTAAAVATLAPVLARLRRGVTGTALELAWPWTAFVWFAWLIVPVVTVVPSPLRLWRDVMWYLAAVLALVPPIAVLGARRATARVWTWFVLVPLVLVFAWPLAPMLRRVGNPAAFSLEEPVLAGYLLVVVMGAGNYLGMRFSVAALLWVVGLALVVVPLCPATAKWVPEATAGRFWGTLSLVAAGWIADRLVARARRRSTTGPALNRVWCGFCDLFGIVWARRLQDRFNDDARRKGLPLRLGMHGFEAPPDQPVPAEFDAQSLAAAEESLRWLLQKFVDPAWIDRQLT